MKRRILSLLLAAVLCLKKPPVITVSAVFGMRTESGRTVWIRPVSRRISPFAKTSAPAPRRAGDRLPAR